jgi:hypothetical protein
MQYSSAKTKSTSQQQTLCHFTLNLGKNFIEDPNPNPNPNPTVTVKCRSAIKALSFYFDLCLSVMFDIYNHILSY